MRTCGRAEAQKRRSADVQMCKRRAQKCKRRAPVGEGLGVGARLEAHSEGRGAAGLDHSGLRRDRELAEGEGAALGGGAALAALGVLGGRRAAGGVGVGVGPLALRVERVAELELAGVGDLEGARSLRVVDLVRVRVRVRGRGWV